MNAKARKTKPVTSSQELAQHASEVHRRGAGAFHHRAHGPGAPGVLGRDASRDAQFTDCGDIHHQRRF